MVAINKVCELCKEVNDTTLERQLYPIDRPGEVWRMMLCNGCLKYLKEESFKPLPDKVICGYPGQKEWGVG